MKNGYYVPECVGNVSGVLVLFKNEVATYGTKHNELHKDRCSVTENTLCEQKRLHRELINHLTSVHEYVAKSEYAANSNSGNNNKCKKKLYLTN
jgi:hypothetical protein